MQLLVLHILTRDKQTMRELIKGLDDYGVKKTQRAVYGMMVRMQAKDWVVQWSEAETFFWTITKKGLEEYMRTLMFYASKVKFFEARTKKSLV
jgi:DNA-binding PadR family transcriptional regulator